MIFSDPSAGLGWPLHPPGPEPELPTLLVSLHRETRRSVTPWVTRGKQRCQGRKYEKTRKNLLKKMVAFCQKGWQVLFVSQNVFLVLFFWFYCGQCVWRKTFLETFSSKTRRLRLGGMNNLEELATHGISLKWLQVPKSQKRQACFGWNDFKERSEKQKNLWMYDVFLLLNQTRMTHFPDKCTLLRIHEERIWGMVSTSPPPQNKKVNSQHCWAS